MNLRPSTLVQTPAPGAETLYDDVVQGLRRRPKQLPCKYFYDERGSQLFEEICGLDEYYLTRTELAIMDESAAEMARCLGPGCMLIELGSGSSLKTRLLLDQVARPAAYVPVDISADHQAQAAADLALDYPGLPVLPLFADFAAPFSPPACDARVRRRVVYFPGSTIGNFEPHEAHALLANMAVLCGAAGGLLIGVDLVKPKAVIEAAYDDARGVTAEFNRNILVRINRELGADFHVRQFVHRALYNVQLARVEIYLVSRTRQTVSIGGETFHFQPGEAICTEYSHKYEIEQFAALAQEAGWILRRSWTDERRLFAVLYLET
jgi:dimethylhistidine N-methyltransferase